MCNVYLMVYDENIWTKYCQKLLKDWPYVACHYLPYYLPSYNTPKKGDIVLFYNGSDYEHTGLVTKVQGARFWTIEGNTKKNNRSYS